MDFFFASVLGLICSFALIGFLRPVLPAVWHWAWQGVIVHCALWLIMHAVLVVILGRPWFAMAIGLAFLMLLIQVSNAKYHSLREPFVFQDFEYFTDAVRHPRLYIPFLGWWKFAVIAVAVMAALGVGLGLEAAPPDRFSPNEQLGYASATLLAGIMLLRISKGGPRVVFLPDSDMRQFGLVACLWYYGWAEQSPLVLPNMLSSTASISDERPDIVVVQSESFFDPRRLFSGIRPDILAEFDRINGEALFHGQLKVPAWGANTVRSEFAFLTGVTEAMLGVHRFNPYRQILKTEVVTLAKVLKRAGYRTICVHPYPASFYGRKKVYPHFGFDEFIDICSFNDDDRVGPYISDAAVGGMVKSVINLAKCPVFVFVITMENHGPLHLEKPLPEECSMFYASDAPPACDDLVVYLRHLKNADRMIGELRSFLTTCRRSVRLCWYGDHVPIITEAYSRLGDPDGRTEYFIWSNQQSYKESATPLSLSELALKLVASF